MCYCSSTKRCRCDFRGVTYDSFVTLNSQIQNTILPILNITLKTAIFQLDITMSEINLVTQNIKIIIPIISTNICKMY